MERCGDLPAGPFPARRNIAEGYPGENAALLKEAIKYFVDNNEPKAIIAYSVACDKTTYELLQYAIDKGVKVYVVDNTLRLRNLRRLSSNG